MKPSWICKEYNRRLPKFLRLVKSLELVTRDTRLCLLKDQMIINRRQHQEFSISLVPKWAVLLFQNVKDLMKRSMKKSYPKNKEAQEFIVQCSAQRA